MPGFQSTQLATEGALEPFFFLYTDDSIQGNPETCKQSNEMLNYEVKNNMPAYAVELAVYTGMRVSELATLKWSDVTDGVISINKSAKHNRLRNKFSVGETKTKKSRIYPTDEQITELLTQIRNMQIKYRILCEWIFTDGNGGYTHARNITNCMTRICRENGLCGGGITKLRKTTSSDLQSSG